MALFGFTVHLDSLGHSVVAVELPGKWDKDHRMISLVFNAENGKCYINMLTRNISVYSSVIICKLDHLSLYYSNLLDNMIL